MIQVNIDEKKVDNFTDKARDTLKEQMGKYADNIIKESNLIEESIREDGANAEITSTIVMQAVRKYFLKDIISPPEPQFLSKQLYWVFFSW